MLAAVVVVTGGTVVAGVDVVVVGPDESPTVFGVVGVERDGVRTTVVVGTPGAAFGARPVGTDEIATRRAGAIVDDDGAGVLSGAATAGGSSTYTVTTLGRTCTFEPMVAGRSGGAAVTWCCASTNAPAIPPNPIDRGRGRGDRVPFAHERPSTSSRSPFGRAPFALSTNGLRTL